MNDAEYRKQRRLLAYVEPRVKKKVMNSAKFAGITMSAQVNLALGRYYQWLCNE